MKILLLGSLLILTFQVAVTPQSSSGSVPATQARYKGFSYMPYDRRRKGWDLLPVHLMSIGGGKLNPKDKTDLYAMQFKNETGKNVTAVKISYFVFNSQNRDEAIQLGQTDLISLQLLPFEDKKIQIHVVYAEDITSLAARPPGEYHLELAVTEVQYEDGSSWLGSNLPQKLNADKVH